MTTTSTRRPATAADLTAGTTVYRGKGKVAHTVVRVESDAWMTYVWVTRVGSKAPAKPFWMDPAREAITVED